LTIVFLNYLFATFLDEHEQSRLLVVALFNQKSDVKFNRDKRLRITTYGLNVNDYIDNSQEGTVDETMLKPDYEKFVYKIHLNTRGHRDNQGKFDWQVQF
jgi:hypothetical protein